jgi:hypothetical protein
LQHANFKPGVTMRRIVVLILAVTAVTATAAAFASRSPNPSCVRVFERQRACTQQFIPALVDLRASVDKPHGIAADVAEPGGRERLITQALAEWKDDSSPEGIDRTCSSLMPAKTRGAEKCLAEPDCDGFVKCVIPMIKPHL